MESKAKDKKKTEKVKEKDKYLAYAQRCRADFLNYKKEEAERFKKMVDYEKEGWALELLSILDQFERARDEISKKKADAELLEGFLQIEKYFEDFLSRQGVAEIETEIGQKFDPNFEEVIETVEDKAEEGTILEIIQKGYQYKGKVIRPARVRVSKEVNKNINDK